MIRHNPLMRSLKQPAANPGVDRWAVARLPVGGCSITIAKMIQIDSFDMLEQARRRSHAEPVVIFKHSNSCWVSSWARREVALLSKENVPVFEVVVQKARHLSNEIEQRYGIRHESPQVIILHNDRPTFDASHGNVRENTIRQALNRMNPKEELP